MGDLLELKQKRYSLHPKRQDENDPGIESDLRRVGAILRSEEVSLLRNVPAKGKHGAQKYKRAHALLLANDQPIDKESAKTVGMHLDGTGELRLRFAEEGFEIALDGKQRGHGDRSITGEDETRPLPLRVNKSPPLFTIGRSGYCRNAGRPWRTQTRKPGLTRPSERR